MRLRRFWDDFKYGVENLIRWFPVIWRDRDWDHCFLLTLMEKKMQQMSAYHLDHGHTTSAEQIARQLAVSARLCQRVRDGHCDDAAEKRFPYPEGWELKFEGNRVVFPPDPNRTARIRHSETVRKMDKDLLGRMISKYIDHWWD